MQHDVWSVGFWMKRKKNTVRPIQKMTALNEVIEEGGLHSTGKCNKSYGEDAGFIATKEKLKIPRRGKGVTGCRTGQEQEWWFHSSFKLSRVPGTIQVAR
jgi:hypothetical protein